MKWMGLLAFIMSIEFLAPAAGRSDPAGGPMNQVDVVVQSADYRIVPVEGGQRIVMDGFGYRMQPGMPMLPEKKLLIALPPGARVLRVEAQGMDGGLLQETYRIVPAPPIVPLGESRERRELAARMQLEWREHKEVAYSTDDAYPKDIARITGSGALRKYAFASVSVCPFSYHPLSGRLTLYDAVRVTVHFSLPAPGTARALETEMLMHDRAADRKAASLFVNYGDVKDLYDAGRSAARIPLETYDYVIVTVDSLAATIAASDFIAWKTALGFNVRTVLLTDAEIAGRPGVDLAERIRNFLRSRYAQWGMEYVLIVGDYATVPMRYSYPNPADHTHNPYNYASAGGSVPSDNYYADLSFPDADSWDADGDGYHGEYLQDNPDFLAEVSVGRIPTSDKARIAYVLDKLVRFEDDDGAWKDRALQPGSILFFYNQNRSGVPKIDGSTLLNKIQTDIMSGWAVSRYTEKSGLSPSSFPWPAVSMAAWIGDWQTGQYGVVNWSGHGSPHGVFRTVWDWDDGDGVPETDGSDGMSRLPLIDCWCAPDDDYPSIVFAVSCNVGYPEPNAGGGNLGIDLLTKPGFGAAAGIVSSSRPAYISANFISNPGGAESFCYEFNRFEISESERIGDALYDAKWYCHQNYGWDHYAEHVNQCNFNLYGDPSMVRRIVTTAVDNGDLSETPQNVLLMQNYPNPFNPSTVIRYDLPRAAHVNLAVYNVNGELVATLVNERMDAGRKETAWTAKDERGKAVSSGVYFYRLVAGDVVRTKKMVLLK